MSPRWLCRVVLRRGAYFWLPNLDSDDASLAMASERGLKALEHAERLAVIVREAIKHFPAHEGRLVDQLRRAVDSVALNIAEGSTRVSYKHYRSFLDTARASLKEVGAAMRIANGSGYVAEALFKEFEACFEETSKTLFGLMRSITERIERGEKRPFPGMRSRPPPPADPA